MMTSRQTHETQQYIDLLYPDPPDEAWLVVSWVEDSFRSKWFRSTQRKAVVQHIVRQARRYNVYLGLGLRHPECTPTPGTRGERAEVYALPGLWIEFDHNAGVHTAKHLPTPDELLNFIQSLPFRFSLLIDSGGGYHGYVLFKELWVLDTEAKRDAADLLLKRFQRTIQEQAAAHGWKVDSTADLPRVLRPTGTLNHKPHPPKPVTLLHEDAIRYNPSDIADAPWLATIEETYTPSMGPGDFPPTQLDPIGTGCAWLQHCRDDAATLPEPEWYGMLGIVGRCVEGLQIAHEWSTPYPRYSKEETASKLKHALEHGPLTCSTIRYDKGGDDYCRSCQHWGRLKSPIVLGMSRTAGDERPLPYSDYTNALAFVRQHGQDLRYCYPWKSWLVWTGTHWQHDTSGAVMRLAKQTVKRLARHAEDLEDKDAIAALLAHVKRSLSTAALKALMENAQSEPGIPVQPEAFDADPWLLNCANGTLDLRTGTLRPHDRADLLTKYLPIAYDTEAQCPTWNAFLDRIMNQNQNLIGFLQRAVGYALTGVIREHVLLILWGKGRNGKSTFLNTLRTLLGLYAIKAPSELLMVSNNDRRPTERADLFGKRFVAAIETEQGRRLAEVFVKEATGGDPIRARRMREDFWEFQPTHKVFLATNHKPVITGTDTAIWERIRLIPFTVTIPKDERDTTLPDKLQDELSGILAWAVRGCLTWQKDGLGEPDEVQQATTGYRAEMDVLGQFITECCLVGPNYRVKADKLYDAYKVWHGEQAQNQRAWGMALTDRGHERYTNNGTWYRGIAIRDYPANNSRNNSTEGTEPTEGKNGIHSSLNSSRGQTRKIGSVPSVPSVEPSFGEKTSDDREVFDV